MNLTKEQHDAIFSALYRFHVILEPTSLTKGVDYDKGFVKNLKDAFPEIEMNTNNIFSAFENIMTRLKNEVKQGLAYQYINEEDMPCLMERAKHLGQKSNPDNYVISDAELLDHICKRFTVIELILQCDVFATHAEDWEQYKEECLEFWDYLNEILNGIETN